MLPCASSVSDTIDTGRPFSLRSNSSTELTRLRVCESPKKQRAAALPRRSLPPREVSSDSAGRVNPKTPSTIGVNAPQPTICASVVDLDLKQQASQRQALRAHASPAHAGRLTHSSLSTRKDSPHRSDAQSGSNHSARCRQQRAHAAPGAVARRLARAAGANCSDGPPAPRSWPRRLVGLRATPRPVGAT